MYLVFLNGLHFRENVKEKRLNVVVECFVVEKEFGHQAHVLAIKLC
jgi:hypothetical protein